MASKTNPTYLFLVRHAETTMISKKLIHGNLDAPLSKKGLRDSQKAADHFKDQGFDVLYTSTLGRAMHTAKIIGKAINKTPVPIEGLRERHYGILEGKSLELFEPDGSGAWYFRPFVNLALWLTGESEQKFIKRVINSIEEIVLIHKGQRIMAVVHWGILSILSLYLQGKPLDGWRNIGPWTACGVTIYEYSNPQWSLIRLNDDSYL